MTAVDDLVKKYLDEISLFVPVPAVITFFLGIVLVGIGGSTSSIWYELMSAKFSKIWEFNDVIMPLPFWKVFGVAVLSVLGSSLTKLMAMQFLSRGKMAISRDLKRIYQNAMAVSKSNPESLRIELDAAARWKKQRSIYVWGLFRLASGFFSLTLISFLSLNLFDVLIGVVLLVLALFFTFQFAVKYLVACLPERIFQDAALGLIEPRIFEDITGAVDV
ncbi:hypothetical protein [Xanthomonas translucens]|uniref:hypothetical protein n=1 Tax=Xanthomonas campestris pv. translucens TaxID=343 RepID=UPI000AA750BB|nr:hypothetical protein [Xanthomonas translucens]QEN95138.1 hypothetical protein F0H33_18850 [Xanthomonas translucens pv. undulosa]QEO28016.1 hypothetical protein F0H32_19200 [Xanthomonas translucens pv. undulosa]UJB14947.1 hypothetical protein LTC53_18790 [Xanthomonas translucens pv. undulosa]UPU49663.1 hypothetical protein MZO50_04205 [Xanthomonas translucens pv. undulosa]